MIPQQDVQEKFQHGAQIDEGKDGSKESPSKGIESQSGITMGTVCTEKKVSSDTVKMGTSCPDNKGSSEAVKMGTECHENKANSEGVVVYKTTRKRSVRAVLSKLDADPKIQVATKVKTQPALVRVDLASQEIFFRQKLAESSRQETSLLQRTQELTKRLGEFEAEEERLVCGMIQVRNQVKMCRGDLSESSRLLANCRGEKAKAEAGIKTICDKRLKTLARAQEIGLQNQVIREQVLKMEMRGVMESEKQKNSALLKAEMEKSKAASSALENEKGKHADTRLFLKMERDLHAFTSENLETEKKKNLCVLCMTRDREVLILPCSHLLYCRRCLQEHPTKQNACPGCHIPSTAHLVYKL